MENLRPRQFWATASMALLVVGGFNVVIERFASNLPPQQLLSRIREKVPLAQTVFVGGSQIKAATDPAAFSSSCAKGVTAFNAGLGATDASEHCLILEYLLPLARSADTVAYGFFDTFLTEPVPASWRDLVGNRSLAYLFPARASALLAPDDPSVALRMRVIASVPMIRERMSIWAKVERARRRFSRIGLPPEAPNRFGRAKDFTVLEPPDPGLFEAGLKVAVEKGRPFNRSVGEIIRQSVTHGLKFYLIEMPVPTSHRQRFYSTPSWSAYQQHVRQMTDAAGGQFVDASDWMSDEYFTDPLHLNAIGAAGFSGRLAREICPARIANAHE